MALTAAAVSDNNLFGPDAVMYDLTDDGLAATASVVITTGQVFTPDFAFVQPTSTAAAARAWSAIITSPGGVATVTVSTAIAGGAAGTARVTIGRWPKPQNRS